MLDAALIARLGALQPVVVVSRATLAAHAHHPEVGVADYRLAQHNLDEGELYQQGEGRLVALWAYQGRLDHAALKLTASGEKNYWLTLFVTTATLADEQVCRRLTRLVQ